MKKLFLAPLNTALEPFSLEAIARLLKKGLIKKYDSVEIIPQKELSRSETTGLFSHVGMTEQYGFSVHNFCGSLNILNYLAKTYGTEDVLAVTDLPLVALGGDLLNGRAHPQTRKAIFSSHLFKSEEVPLRLAGLGRLALHEAGHIQGLEHHATLTDALTDVGKYCPMITGLMLAESEKVPVGAPSCYQFIADFFCGQCEEYLQQ